MTPAILESGPLWDPIVTNFYAAQCPLPVFRHPSRTEQSSTKLPPCTLGTENQAWAPNASPSNGAFDPAHWIGGWDTPSPSDGVWIASDRRYLVIPCVRVRTVRSGIRRCVRDRFVQGGFIHARGFGVIPHVWYLWHVSPSMFKQPCPLVHISLSNFQLLSISDIESPMKRENQP